jgi:twitching motility protein PilT
VDQTPPAPQLHAFANLLLAASQSGCSDVHVRANSPPWGRRGGRLVPLGDGSVGSDAIASFVQATAQRPFTGTSIEYSFDVGDKLRARCHAFRDVDGWALAIRLVPPTVPTFAELRLPPVIKSFAEPRPGLLLITGPMGSGKSTTAAAVLTVMASREPVRLITLEDPIEHRIGGPQACVSQREVGRDTATLEQGLHRKLHEVRDARTCDALGPLALAGFERQRGGETAPDLGDEAGVPLFRARVSETGWSTAVWLRPIAPGTA